MKKRLIGLAAATVLATGAVLGGTATTASASGDYVYSGTSPDGQGGTVYHYTNAAGHGAYFDSWQGMFWSPDHGGTVVYWNVR